MSLEFRAAVSLHTGHHNKTPRERFGAVEASSDWTNADLSPLELIEHISRGHAWIGCHLDGARSEAAAGPSNLIVLDIDGDLSLEAFWAIAPVARHCLFTATSCSHTAAEHRFRAVFRVEEHDDPELHRAIYHQWLDRLGLKLKDNSGEKPERLWFGNDQTEVQFGGGGEPIPWDVVEAARDALTKTSSALPQARNLGPDSDPERHALEIRQAAYAFDHLLRKAVDGDYMQGGLAAGGTTDPKAGYWLQLMQAAAATGDEQVQEAFLRWHQAGHMAKSQGNVRRRLPRAGNRIPPGAAVGKILLHVADQHGAQWRRLLPSELRWQGAPQLRPPTVLGRSRSASDIAPLGAPHAPDVVPSAVELQKLAASARHTPLGVSSAANPTAAAPPATQPQPLTLDQQLRQLYFLRAHDQLVVGDEISQVLEEEFTSLDRELLGALLSHPGYCNQPSEVESDLLKMFRREHSFRQKTRARVASFKLTGTGRKRAQWLIPNFLVVGGEHVLYAKGGVGKTTLALHMARAITGDPEINRFLDSGVYDNQPLWRKNPVLFIGTDMHGSAEEMTNAYLEDFGLAGKDFLDQVEWWFQDDESGKPPWMLCLKDLVHLYEYLEAQMSKGAPVAAVFIDSMKAVCPDHLLVGQQGFKDYIKLVKDICKKFNAALIWVHHARGDGSGAQGIQRITEESDANFHLKRDDKTKQLTLEVEKIRGGKAREIPLSLFTSAGPRVTERLDSDDDDADLGKAGRERAVLEVLAEGFKIFRLHTAVSADYADKTYVGMKIGEIKEAIKGNPRYRNTGFSEASLKRTIADLRDRGRITGKSSYRLSSNFQPVINEQETLLDDTSPDLPGW